VRWTVNAKQIGDFLGIPATGKSYTIPGIDIYRVQDGKMAEHWHVVDLLSMLQQVGAIPSPEDPKA
jgi:predicted ester cyclase